MKGLAQAVAGMKLVDTKEIVAQGKRAYHAGIRFSDNPFKPSQTVEVKCWNNGWKNAQAAWNENLRRNNGSMSGIRSTYANFLP
jgi:ribosome modulation factor